MPELLQHPRSNPGTYTKLSDIIRNPYASETGLSACYFSFNRREGASPSCKGMGAVEVKMRYLPSIWITCSECGGRRFKDEFSTIRISTISIAHLLLLLLILACFLRL